MYCPHKVTLFNKYEDSEGNVDYSKTVLDGVFVNKAIAELPNSTSNDSFLVIIPLKVNAGGKTFVNEREFGESVSAKSWTLKNGDFFAFGEVQNVESPVRFEKIAETNECFKIKEYADFTNTGSEHVRHWEAKGA